jgi:hypothetical protein
LSNRYKGYIVVGRRGALSPICSTQDVLGKRVHVPSARDLTSCILFRFLFCFYKAAKLQQQLITLALIIWPSVFFLLVFWLPSWSPSRSEIGTYLDPHPPLHSIKVVFIVWCILFACLCRRDMMWSDVIWCDQFTKYKIWPNLRCFSPNILDLAD